MEGKVHGSACQIVINEAAVCGLPFRLTVTGIVFAVLLLLSAVHVSGFLEQAKEQEALDEVSKLIDVAEQISMRGGGSEIAFELRIPQGVSVDFGALPDLEENWPEDADNYCITIGGKSTFYPVAASFSNPEFDGPFSLGPGRHMVVLSTKLEPESGRLFVLISETGVDGKT
ncbi:hypothetical protein MSSAC_0867 [Methanosarcina siciliae C2J]|uniref:Uncharacterized protein n=1 Tax=Methanosarcina siciliae C2J TaxID=1434118 RepID=A0A0E3PL54_9EURY|nr:hypothetical protein [Methanosarcina siciliae]AKB35457.1 hypothetical protein MSSAC_0867 [Methanosarcina siciliae C2J]